MLRGPVIKSRRVEMGYCSLDKGMKPLHVGNPSYELDMFTSYINNTVRGATVVTLAGLY